MRSWQSRSVLQNVLRQMWSLVNLRDLVRRGKKNRTLHRNARTRFTARRHPLKCRLPSDEWSSALTVWSACWLVRYKSFQRRLEQRQLEQRRRIVETAALGFQTRTSYGSPYKSACSNELDDASSRRDGEEPAPLTLSAGTRARVDRQISVTG